MLSKSQITQFSLFSNLTEEYLLQVMEKASLVEYGKGSLIFKRGKVCGQRFYLLSGNVDLVNKDWLVESVAANSDRAKWPLNESSPTIVSAMAKTNVTLMQLDKDFLDVVLAWSESAARKMAEDDTYMPDISFANLPYHTIDVEEGGVNWMSALLQSPLFTRLPVTNLQKAIQKFEAVSLKAGDIILKEGMPGDYFYVIDTGRVHVTSQASHIDVYLGPGNVFGEEALVGDTLRNATVTMEKDGILMRLDKSDFQQLLQEPLLEHLNIESLQQLDQHNQVQLLDIRLPIEHKHQRVPETKNIPLANLRKKLKALDASRTYVVTDDGGRRSILAVHLMCSAGLNACLLSHSEQFYIGL